MSSNLTPPHQQHNQNEIPKPKMHPNQNSQVPIFKNALTDHALLNQTIRILYPEFFYQYYNTRHHHLSHHHHNKESIRNYINNDNNNNNIINEIKEKKNEENEENKENFLSLPWKNVKFFQSLLNESILEPLW